MKADDFIIKDILGRERYKGMVEDKEINPLYSSSKYKHLVKLGTVSKGDIGEEITKSVFTYHGHDVKKRTHKKHDHIIDNKIVDSKIAMIDMYGAFNVNGIRKEHDYLVIHLLYKNKLVSWLMNQIDYVKYAVGGGTGVKVTVDKYDNISHNTDDAKRKYGVNWTDKIEALRFAQTWNKVEETFMKIGATKLNECVLA